MANDNLARLKQAYARWNESKGKDEKVWLDLMADDVRILSLAAGAPGIEFTREVRSRADLQRYFEGLREGWEMIHYTVDEYIVDGDRIVAMGTMSWRHRKTGNVFNSPKADFAFFKNGRIAEWYEFYDTAALMAAMKS